MEKFQEKINEVYSKKTANCTWMSKDKYNRILDDVIRLTSDQPKNSREFRIKEKYAVLEVGGVKQLATIPIADVNNPRKITYKRYVHLENVYDILWNIHINTGHGGRDRMQKDIESDFENITREMLMIFLNTCESCVLKGYTKKSGLVTNPILTMAFNERVQADLIDMQAQACQEFRHILVYQDHFKKLVQIRPLKRKTARATTSVIFDLFCTFGAPDTLQTDNGREFKNHILKELCNIMGVTMKHGNPRHSQSNGGVERANQDIEKMLCTWKADHEDLPWVTGLLFVQMYKNNALCVPIKMSPFEGTFGVKMIKGLQDSIVPNQLLKETKTEEDLRQLGVITEEDTIIDDIWREIELEKKKDITATNDNINREGLQKQADRMLQQTVRKLPDAAIGCNVKLKIPPVDRTRVDFSNLLGVVTEVIGVFPMYKIGTRSGVLRGVFNRKDFTVVTQSFMMVSDVPAKEVELRKAASEASLFGGQGLTMCNCKSNCNSKTCGCRKKDLMCNSKCHQGNISCKNNKPMNK